MNAEQIRLAAVRYANALLLDAGQNHQAHIAETLQIPADDAFRVAQRLESIQLRLPPRGL